jgi:hypothetical protein
LDEHHIPYLSANSAMFLWIDMRAALPANATFEDEHKACSLKACTATVEKETVQIKVKGNNKLKDCTCRRFAAVARLV